MPQIPGQKLILPGRASRLATAAAAGALYGFATSLIPSPHAVGMFWISNLASPWLLLAFAFGTLHVSRIWAVAAGVITDVACVVGFYAHFLFTASIAPGEPGPPGLWLRVERNFGPWLHFIAVPWLMLAITAGTFYGLLGFWWKHKQSLIAPVLLGLAFAAEPWGWRLYAAPTTPVYLWPAETAFGIVIVIAAACWRRKFPRNRPITNSAEAGTDMPSIDRDATERDRGGS